MSLDNGIFILILKSNKSREEKEYRVAHLHAAENIFNDPDTLIESFEKADIFFSKLSAKAFAEKMNLVEETEYGVSFITQFQDYSWDEIVNVTGVAW